MKLSFPLLAVLCFRQVGNPEHDIRSCDHAGSDAHAHFNLAIRRKAMHLYGNMPGLCHERPAQQFAQDTTYQARHALYLRRNVAFELDCQFKILLPSLSTIQIEGVVNEQMQVKIMGPQVALLIIAGCILNFGQHGGDTVGASAQYLRVFELLTAEPGIQQQTGHAQDRRKRRLDALPYVLQPAAQQCALRLQLVQFLALT